MTIINWTSEGQSAWLANSESTRFKSIKRLHAQQQKNIFRLSFFIKKEENDQMSLTDFLSWIKLSTGEELDFTVNANDNEERHLAYTVDCNNKAELNKFNKAFDILQKLGALPPTLTTPAFINSAPGVTTTFTTVNPNLPISNRKINWNPAEKGSDKENTLIFTNNKTGDPRFNFIESIAIKQSSPPEDYRVEIKTNNTVSHNNFLKLLEKEFGENYSAFSSTNSAIVISTENSGQKNKPQFYRLWTILAALEIAPEKSHFETHPSWNDKAENFYIRVDNLLANSLKTTEAELKNFNPSTSTSLSKKNTK